jgi:hypothetical protein
MARLRSGKRATTCRRLTTCSTTGTTVYRSDSAARVIRIQRGLRLRRRVLADSHLLYGDHDASQFEQTPGLVVEPATLRVYRQFAFWAFRFQLEAGETTDHEFRGKFEGHQRLGADHFSERPRERSTPNFCSRIAASTSASQRTGQGRPIGRITAITRMRMRW